jgi:hypothetical protein
MSGLSLSTWTNTTFCGGAKVGAGRGDESDEAIRGVNAAAGPQYSSLLVFSAIARTSKVAMARNMAKQEVIGLMRGISMGNIPLF